MSRKEDEAFKKWGEDMMDEVEAGETDALKAWLALPVAREVFRGTIGQNELYRRMNKVAEEQKITLFDNVFDGKDPDKYARSFAVNSIAGTTT